MIKLISSSMKYVLFVVLLLLASCSQSEEKALGILNNKPIFTVHIEGFNVSYFVYVNGVAVYSEYDHSGQVSLAVPVNHFMHPEENTLAVEMVPPKRGAPFKPSARAKAELRVHSDDDPNQEVTIASVAFNEKYIHEGSPTKESSSAGRFEILHSLEESSDGNIEVGEIVSRDIPDYEGAVLYERKLTIPNSLPLWAFFNSDDLPDYFTIPDDEYYPELESLLEEYQKVQEALETGDIESVMPMFEERNREVDLAFYRDAGTTEQGIRESLTESANSDNLKLVGLEAEYVGLSPEDNRKLVKLTRNNERVAIALNFIEGQGSVNYDLVFRREDGEWILTR